MAESSRTDAAPAASADVPHPAPSAVPHGPAPGPAPPAPAERSREQAKQWKKERKLQAQQKKQAPPAPTSEKPKASRPPRDASPMVQLSKAFAYMLRHGAEKEFLAIRPDGYLRVDAILARPKLQKIAMPAEDGATRAPNADDVCEMVRASDKQRFALASGTARAPGEPGDVLWVRAVQGHSLASVTELDLTPLTPETVGDHLSEVDGYHYAIHGTTAPAWSAIVASGALKTMGRNHIHLARGLPGASGVISGMRATSTRLVWVDVDRALADGVPFWVSANGVVLTSGREGALPLAYVRVVRDEQGGQVWP
ncbi:2'-phosphotransferase [Malassezia brasiliensis]|uniref:2'-phosphotransferase n=1 Tax=Malassezia brasiliensis TaxID=1821822 RepID=A0AAF0DY40_9BASI|nr:2'-phosphotransferase [Malassezia brasiliensis]